MSLEIEKKRLIASSTIPSRTSLLADTALLRNTGFNGWLSLHWKLGMFSRPAAQVGKNYDAISRAYSHAVHDVLSGKQQSHQALAQLHVELIKIMHQ